MKRTLIIAALAVLGFTGNAAIADPSLEMAVGESLRNAPEATSYQADAGETRIGEQNFVWNP